METILDFVGSNTVVSAIVVSALLAGAIALVRVALRDMYASRWWRLQRHWDA
jgi:hypothetical protein